MNPNKKRLIAVLSIGLIAGFILSKAIDIKVAVHPRIKQILKSAAHFPKSKVSKKQDTLELCYFENKADLQKVEKDKAEIELSQNNATEGKCSLKCVFPDGGGAVGFYETIPPNWADYISFKFDVYSEEDGIPLSLFIADTNNSSYYDRYNREGIVLREGWNNIEIPISEIGEKLILDRINHLRIFLWQVKGQHVLYFDNIRLTSAEEAKNQPATGPIEISIHPAKEKGKISRLLYGTNLSPKMESDRRIWDFVKDTGISCFRYPGGGSPGWRWKTGAADFESKIQNMPLGNIDYLIKFCEKTDTKIIMQVNIESGTPQEAAELVEFMNKKANFRVEYWELGNEVYGDWDKAYTSPERYAQLIKEYSLAMKAVDPSIKIGANWGERYYDRIKWDEIIIRVSADYIDFISYHWYPNHINHEHEFEGRVHPTPEEVMANSMEIPNIVARFNRIIERNAPHRKGKIEVTFLEWDGSWDAPSSDPTPPFAQGAAIWSLANAIFYADSLGQFAENGVTVSAHYNLQECMFGLIRGWDPAEGWGGMKWDTETIRPKAFAIELFSRHFGDILIESKVENSPYYNKAEDWWPSSYNGKVPYITCYASKFSDTKKLGIILINKHSEKDLDVEVLIDESGKNYNLSNIWILKGPDIMAQNDGKPRTVKIEKLVPIGVKDQFTVTLPAHSVAAMEIGTP